MTDDLLLDLQVREAELTEERLSIAAQRREAIRTYLAEGGNYRTLAQLLDIAPSTASALIKSASSEG